MVKDLIPIISGCKPVSELKQVSENLSTFGYVKGYIDVYWLQDKEWYYCSNGITGQVDFLSLWK